MIRIISITFMRKHLMFFNTFIWSFTTSWNSKPCGFPSALAIQQSILNNITCECFAINTMTTKCAVTGMLSDQRSNKGTISSTIFFCFTQSHVYDSQIYDFPRLNWKESLKVWFMYLASRLVAFNTWLIYLQLVPLAYLILYLFSAVLLIPPKEMIGYKVLVVHDWRRIDGL